MQPLWQELFKKAMLINYMLMDFKAKVMAQRRISCVSCYISLKTSLCLMGHKENSACPLSPGFAGAEGGVAGDFMVVLNRSGVGD